MVFVVVVVVESFTRDSFSLFLSVFFLCCFSLGRIGRVVVVVVLLFDYGVSMFHHRSRGKNNTHTTSFRTRDDKTLAQRNAGKKTAR